ncbi:MAG: hypothetical protein J6Y17_03355 [Elusimicrobiaceae bacterium]|nr:hypothetical protein [Elusimicrobiaceae bacterium]
MYGLCGGVLFFLGILLFVVVLLASKNGSKAARLEALKTELKKQEKEQMHAKQIRDKVYHLSTDDAKRRLHQIASK